jgi:hypothetical protein
LLGYALVYRPSAIGPAGMFAGRQALRMSLRLPLALLTASFLSELLPGESVAGVIGPASGMVGIVVASLAGGVLPGGPMVSFPLAIFLWREGAGAAQLVALLAGWSVFAFHRMISYELPLMGTRFSTVRLLASFLLPPLAGVLAAGLFGLLGFSVHP